MAEKGTVRTRIAPSPTGDPHIGTAYQLLFNYCFAKSQGGQCILRIEDTDQQRSTAQSEQAILDSLKWLAIPYDEGPDKDGPYGPYRQSERTALYREKAALLLEKGHGYRCFCTAERLEALRQEQKEKKVNMGYDGHCRGISAEESQKRADAGEPFVVRMMTPDSGECEVQDLLRGVVRIPWENVDDQVLLKSDGFPTYHLANVVDDHEMAISHVLRGEEWINSAPKHLLLYEYFGWEAPVLCHLPLLRNPDRSKLSKRKNPTSILYYRQAGFLPEAVVNYLGLMGYAMADERERFSLEEMVADFDIKRVSLGGPVFDVQKLQWLNGCYLRESLTPENLFERMEGWMLNREHWSRILPLVQPRVEKLADIIPMTAYFFQDQPEYEWEALIPKKMKLSEENLPADMDAVPEKEEMVARVLQLALWELEQCRDWAVEPLKECFGRISEKEGLKARDLLPPFFVAITGAPVSPPLFDSMEILGSNMTRRRIQRAMDLLAEAGKGLSKKKIKALEKYYCVHYSE